MYSSVTLRLFLSLSFPFQWFVLPTFFKWSVSSRFINSHDYNYFVLTLFSSSCILTTPFDVFLWADIGSNAVNSIVFGNYLVFQCWYRYSISLKVYVYTFSSYYSTDSCTVLIAFLILRLQLFLSFFFYHQGLFSYCFIFSLFIWGHSKEVSFKSLTKVISYCNLSAEGLDVGKISLPVAKTQACYRICDIQIGF